MLILSTSATTVELWTTCLQSAPSLVIRTSARRLAKPVPKQGTLKEVVVVEAVEVVIVGGVGSTSPVAAARPS
jgi:hypothetical protein